MKGKNKLPAVDGEGVPLLLPQKFDDYLDGKRLIPSSTFSDQVARAGGEANLPYIRLRDADNNLLKIRKYMLNSQIDTRPC